MLIRPEDLEAIDRVVYEPKKEELIGRTLFNLKTDVPSGAEVYGYDVITRSGSAKVLAPGADDIPLVDADKRRHKMDIFSIAAAIRYSIQELRNAQMAGITVDSTKAEIARRAIAEKENRIIWHGDADHNIPGVVNAEGIQTTAVDAGASGKTEWRDKTGKEIVADIRKARNLINRLPGHTANTLILTPAGMEMLEMEYNANTDKTVLEYIRSQNWFTNIVATSDLEGQGTGGTDCFLVLDNSPSVIQILLTMDIFRHETEYKFPNYKVPFEERLGGAIVRYPMAIVRGDGI
ncbi:DUF2184 domain-containing protein [Priestia filamentosa]|uniref:DUF2184 domain-containing protein n=1 Tax=Priestia filamentosa TaxID=1402861 RepID=UPI000A08D5B5|nr:family 1 encapsulin nanocompartment shell protein [Priestia filamentosa]MDT3762979.1 family 1 encapsulin nanocompartment shell protein [Priestia filamentosa]OXS69500.1 major capsid protein [Priestia filamentosa]WRU97422.1 family 1 encapsulin nanocompartment shell protein [Priestia filamentosa]SMF33303.1 hypothetical protein SAMN06296056_102786 [Priestia filamentosa]